MKFKLLVVLLFALMLINCDRSSNTIKVGFWNVENLFDLENDPIKEDDEFATGGDKLMNQEILDLKLAHLTEVLTDLDVDILGICEVENRKVLEMWNNHYPNRDYTIVHYESPDSRGIDAALFYDSEKFSLLESSPIGISFSDGDPSRDILYVKGIALNDTLHIFVNHWPSNYSGLERGIGRRAIIAKVLRKYIDNILHENNNANIILMGDFNENPLAHAVQNLLLSSMYKDSIAAYPKMLWNTMEPLLGVENGGTYKYRGIDGVIDQFIVSQSLIDDTGLEIIPNSVKILTNPKYRQKEGNYAGYPFRFWVGDNLLGGYSDHMAIQCKIKLKK